MIFDTHAHYDDEAFDEDRDRVLMGLKEAGVGTVLNVGASMASSESTLALTEQYPFVYGSAGVHPSETAELDEEKFQRLCEILKNPKILAVGEIGLDYYWEEPEHEIQKKWFLRQLELARQMQLSVIIHSRDAAKDTLDMMKEARAGEIGGVIHCFSYGTEIAREYLNMGFFLGIGGVLTFKNAKKLKEVAAYAPIEQIVLETDCPYMAPTPHRGTRNTSANLPYVVNALAEIKGILPEQVIEITEQNARRLYRMDVKAVR
ncbi:TatD family deoxyribonuclease [Clostridium sp. AM29-11AC]|uniref:TatD family hydrolase n=1 Tax=Clostridium sp. AM29-11AC TaxID=2293028 RepID=UPI000E50C890|nr:TatD family hydrolase [Clostridium sp. AM29-11AC]RHT55134.1 TatD family deoxyribonuclease [Clostridium sp. AM29-11AC]